MPTTMPTATAATVMMMMMVVVVDGGCELLSTMKRFHSEKDEIVAAKLRSSSGKSVDNEFQLIHTFFLLSVFIALKHSTLNVHKKKGSHRFLFLCLSACSLARSLALPAVRFNPDNRCAFLLL